jgi:hypothetical protein
VSQRIVKSWLIFASIENFEHDRCVDFFSRPEGSFGFEETRRDPEDRGAWTPVQYHSGACLFLEGSCTHSRKAIGSVVSRSNLIEPLRTKIAAVNFKLRDAAQFGKLRSFSKNNFRIWHTADVRRRRFLVRC